LTGLALESGMLPRSLAILLAAHADTVGVERDKWPVDPFAGLIEDGHVYGRGTIDCEKPP
jgi:acetylornithine deacetylase/succinyl-diaminopimelate desuccinylase-like protein